ncbi:hypothetical protein EDF60_1439 [Leucobacter luti]|nr:hypothetical protein [Leucobacter luti]TCK46190.1 hypothetical protein EDF60_1439 [Leucobacter luti]
MSGHQAAHVGGGIVGMKLISHDLGRRIIGSALVHAPAPGEPRPCAR